MIGWTWVGVQALLLGALIVLPSRDDWSVPPWLGVVAAALFFGGLAIVAVAALGLGSSLTATPVPNQRGDLTTDGFYRYVRHPIYTGVLALVAGMTLRSSSWLHVVVAVITFIFFDRKAAWEEARLAEEFDDYPTYAAHTSKFFPLPWRRAPRP